MTLIDTRTAVKTSSERSTTLIVPVLEKMRKQTARLDRILRPCRLALRVKVEGRTILIGDQTAMQGAVEFSFSSFATFDRLFREMRLFKFAMAYVDGEMEINGSPSRAAEILDAMNLVTDRHQTIQEYIRLLLFRMSKVLLPSVALRFESLDHYSNSARAYEMFLDKNMQYTCGRFETGVEDIDTAQIQKFSFIADLAQRHGGSLAGKRHLDIGSGWGGMTAYFAQTYGTTSVGNTNCPAQMKYARRHFKSNVFFGDFSALREASERFDLITVVGMIEHLTPSRRTELLRLARQLLNEDGILYVQCIAKPRAWIGGDAYRLVEREVFQGHWLEYREQLERRFANNGFEILESFDHSNDYGLTTACWAEKIEARKVELSRVLGDRNYRLYLAYLSYASRLFFSGRGSLMRYVLRRQN